ncbi:DUF2231 domain-containing protein [Microbacterium sp. NPDC057650]|uniref:DUF2231 domain-containing protein n=1 Tax=unclassified Microbacterium TaxID=2609290 RepID=UPI00366E1C9C
MDIFLADDGFRIAGLPLHPLLVHAVVVLTPLTALAVALAAVWPAARRRLGWAPPIAAAIVAGLVPITVLAGQNLAATVGYTPAILHHEALGLMLIPWTIALLIAAVAAAWWDRTRPRLQREHPTTARVLGLLVPTAALVASAGTIIVTVLTGDAGARIVWGGI